MRPNFEVIFQESIDFTNIKSVKFNNPERSFLRKIKR